MPHTRTQANPDSARGGTRPVIIVAGKGERFAPGTLDYALGVAERLGADILAVSVNTLPAYDDDPGPGRALRFAGSAAESVQAARPLAHKRGLGFRHLCRKGKVSEVLSDVLHDHRHVSFVLVEEDIPLAAVAQALSVPVFAINGSGASRAQGSHATVPGPRIAGTITRNHDNKGVHSMATDTGNRQARMKALLFGTLSAAIYAAVFTNADLVMEYFTKGGFYNVLPVMTVITVSYVHGSFASNVWTALGINASRKSVKVPAPAKGAPARAGRRPRATVQA